MLRKFRPLFALVLVACLSESSVTPIAVSRIELATDRDTITQGQTVRVEARAYDADNKLLESILPSWSTSASDVAVVNNGYVTGMSPGSATIRAISGSVSASVDFVVIPKVKELSSIVVSLVDPQVEIGQGTMATAQALDAEGLPMPMGARVVTWSSSNESVATVNSAGGVNAVGIGTANIRATVIDGGRTVYGEQLIVTVPIANAPLTAEVAMATERFVPFQTVVKVNGSVQFQFASINHNVIWTPRMAGSPADILVTKNANVSRVFGTVGVFPFVCTVHPGMNGVVVVTP